MSLKLIMSVLRFADNIHRVGIYQEHAVLPILLMVLDYGVITGELSFLQMSFLTIFNS